LHETLYQFFLRTNSNKFRRKVTKYFATPQKKIFFFTFSLFSKKQYLSLPRKKMSIEHVSVLKK